MRELLCSVLNIYVLVIFVRIILSWFPVNPGGPLGNINRVLFQITEPVLGPARRMIPGLGPIDISPIVVVFALGFVQRMLASAGL